MPVRLVGGAPVREEPLDSGAGCVQVPSCVVGTIVPLVFVRVEDRCISISDVR